MAGSALEFTLALIDKISAPAKAMSVALSSVESQLKSVHALLKDMPKLSLKMPGVGGAARENFGPMFGPGRKEAEKAARFREREELKAARAAEKVAAQSARAQNAERLKALRAYERQSATIAKQAERRTVGFHLAQLKQSKAEAAARMAAEKQLEGGGFFKNLAAQATAAAEALGPVGTALTVVAGAALLAGGAVVYLVGKTAGLAIEAAEAKQDTLDMLEAMLGSSDAAQRTLVAIRDITKVTSASQEAVQDSAAALSAAGIKNEKLLTDAVKSVAQVESVLKGKGEKIQAVFEKAAQTGKFEVNAKKLAGTGVQIQSLYAEIAKRTGVGVKAVEGQLKAGKVKAEVGIAALNTVISQKFGAVAAKQAKDLGPQLQRFKDNVSRLFEDVDTSPFLDALDRIVSLFDTATPSGQAMHDVLTSAFNGLFKVVSYVEPYVKTFLKGLVIIALQVAIAFKPLMKSIRAAFGGESQSGPMRLAEIMSIVGLGLNKLIEIAIKLGPVFSVAWSVFKIANSVLVGFAATLFAVPIYIGSLVTAIIAAAAWFAKFGDMAIDAGKNLVSGLIEGIVSAAASLYTTVADVAKGALAKFREVFQEHSPSRAMAGMGVNLAAGLAQGTSAGARTYAGAMVGAGAGMATHAAVGAQSRLMSFAGPQFGVSAMLGQRHLTGNDNSRTEPAPAPQPRLRERSASGGSGGMVFHPGAFAAGSFPITGVANAEQLREIMPEILADAFEQVALMNGTSGD